MKNNKKNFPSSLVVTQSNQLVEARYNLSLGEQRLILAMIAQIQPQDDDFKPYQISIAEFARYIGISKNSMYQECQIVTKKLLERVIEINEIQGLLQIGWVSSAQYIDGKGVINLTFDPLLKPYLLKLKGDFTSCKFEMLLSFRSQYTMRIYSLLKQYEKISVREIELQSLREMLGLRKDQYKKYNDFKKNILELTQKELTKKGDLTFEFDEVKYGRSICAIRFRILTQNITDVADVFDSELINTILTPPRPKNSTISNALIQIIPEQHRAKKTILMALESFEKKYGSEYVSRNILYSNAKADKSYAGFLHNALKNDWGCDFEIDQKTPVKKKARVKEIWERQGFATQKEYDQFMFNQQMQNYALVQPTYV